MVLKGWTAGGLRAALAAAVPAVLVILGGSAGLVIAWTSSHRGSADWDVWAVVVTAMTAASGAAIPYGVRRWRDVNRVAAIPVRAVVPQLVTVWLTAGAFGAVYVLVRLPTTGQVDWRAGLLVLIAGLGTLPALSAITGVGQAATAITVAEPGMQLAALMRLRRLLQGLLVMLGGVVALLVVAAATATKMNDVESPVLSILFGVFTSAMVAIVYTPAASILRLRGFELVERCLPPQDKTGAALVDLAEQRAKMEAVLGVDKTLFSDLQTNLAVVGPLIASAGAVLLQR